MAKWIAKLSKVAVLASLATGCATHYTTPAGGVSLAGIDDGDLREYYARQPASAFPANVAVVRVQDDGYVSHTSRGYGSGRYSVVTTRDVESDADFEKLAGLPMVAGVAPVGRLLMPRSTSTLRDLRTPAAQLRADLLLVYSIDTVFEVDGTPLGPLSLISLGFLPNKEAHVTATVAGALVDVRTGFVYGTTEASATERQRGSMWSTDNAVDSARLDAEREAFGLFVGEFERLWKSVVEVHARTGPREPGLRPAPGVPYETTAGPP